MFRPPTRFAPLLACCANSFRFTLNNCRPRLDHPVEHPGAIHPVKPFTPEKPFTPRNRSPLRNRSPPRNRTPRETVRPEKPFTPARNRSPPRETVHPQEKPFTRESLLPEAPFIIDILAWIIPCQTTVPLGAGHKTDVSVALCLGYQEWLDVGLWECFRFSKEGPNLRKWHKAINGDMVQLRKVIVWGIASSGT